MSGTSLDGIDVAYVNFTFSETWSYQITAAETIPYTQNWQKILSEAVNYDEHKLRKLEHDYTHLLGKVISEFLAKSDIFGLHAVCSHGHTIKHEPENGFTLQIGNQPELAKLLNCKVVCDFRVQDVQLGGQGAPLVPIGDELLFGEYDYCLNIGGFANISTINGGKRLAYDICAVNTVLNVLSQQINLPYDKDGKVAASGKVIPGLREELEKIPFYGLRPPKSLGIEWVQKHIFPLFQKYGSIPALLRTYTEHAAEMIANEFRNSSEEKVLVTGGGAFNQFLIAEIQKRTKTEVVIPPADVVNFKEALIFAFLGVLKLRGENNVLSSVTGASKDHSSGKIFNA